MKGPVPRTGYILLSHWPNLSHISTNSVIFINVIVYLPHSDSKVPLLKTPLTHVFEHGEIELVSN